VIRLGAIGDVVRTLPAVSSLRAAYPRARLTWLVEPAASGILSAQPWIDEVLVFPRTSLRAALLQARLPSFARELAHFVRHLRAERFDLVLDFHAILKSGLLSFASGAERRVSYAPPFGREGAWLFANQRVRLSPERASRFERNAGLLRFLGADAPTAPTPLHVDPAAAARMQAALGGGAAPIAVHPGTSAGTPHKRWAATGYAAVIRALHREHGAHAVVSYGPDPEERSSAADVVRLAAGAARLAPETASLGELAALFAQCRLYLGGDTGPMHVASLVGTPVVQILGPTDPVENEPWQGTPSRSVRVGVACSPCRRGCASATCMQVVPPDLVLAAARELLGPAADGRARAARAGEAGPLAAARSPS
jgi:ADP-heptose:LPS heptosyltransferase